MSPSSDISYLLVGGGLAAATAAFAIRARDKKGRIVLVCGENRLPYHRPPLSKEYLRGETEWDAVLVSPEQDYADHKIDVMQGSRATKLDLSARTITLSDGAILKFDNLCLALGASAKKPSPGDMPGSDAPNVLTLRTRTDSDKIAAYLVEGKRAVLIGAGYIGMEVASDCRAKGVETTIIDTAKQPWGKFTSPEFGAFLRGYYEARGVRFFLDDGVVEIVKNENGQAESVRTKSGHEIPCDFVIAGVGSQLNLDLAKDAGLEVDEKQGVTVNEFLETSTPGVFVAGDIANFRDPVMDKSWHLEHWQNAEWHGQIAGANMAGEKIAYDHVPYFFSDEFDLHMTLRGDPTAGKTSFVIGDMSMKTDRFLELYLRDDGTLAMGLLISKKGDESETADLLEALVRARVPLAPHKDALMSGQAQLAELLD